MTLTKQKITLQDKYWQNILFCNQTAITIKGRLTQKELHGLMYKPLLIISKEKPEKKILRYMTFFSETDKHLVINLACPSDFQPIYPETRELEDFSKLAEYDDQLWAESGNIFTKTSDGFLVKGSWSMALTNQVITK